MIKYTSVTNMPMKHRLYALDNYMKKREFVDNGYEEYEIQSLVKELENDKGYHMRIHPNDNYILYGDCDGYRGSFEEFANLLIGFLDQKYDIRLGLDDFSYTVNESKKGSFHYSVPRIFASASKLHQIHLHFFKEHTEILYIEKTKTKIVDVSVYKEHWFRYPMQAKAGDKKAIHIIKKGSMIDFVVEHIPTGSQCIDEKQYKGFDEEKKVEKVTKATKIVKEPKIAKVTRVTKEPKIKVTKVIKEQKFKVIEEDEESELELEVAEVVKKLEVTKVVKKPMVKLVGNPLTKTNESEGNQIQKNDGKIIEYQKKTNDDQEDDNDGMDFSDREIERLVYMLSLKRCDDYNEWLNVGICLRNISKDYLFLWKKWSEQSEKFDNNACNEKWKGFNKSTDKKLTIGSLLYWCKEDTRDQYDEFMKQRKTKNIISKKFPGVDLKIGETQIVTNIMSYINLENKKCLIYGDNHEESCMYIEMIPHNVVIKCRHNDCFGKTYPCEHVQLTKNEMNIMMNNGTIIINNNYNAEELIEFQKYEIFEDDEVNALVFESLSGTDASMADIIYYYFKDKYNFGEDGNWYEFKNHKWNLIGQNNNKFSFLIGKKLGEIYDKLINYGKETNMGVEKIKEFRKIKKTFGNARSRNDIMTLVKIHFEVNNNPNRDFVDRLDADRYLLVFNNGVFDLRTYTFRDGEPSDCMTMSVGYDYIDTHTEKYEELLQYLSDIQPEKDDRHFLLIYLSHALYGNILEWFTILTGRLGRNGKSKFIEFLGKVFGNFYSTVPSQLFTRPRPDVNSPDPTLLNLKNKKIIVSSEPEKNTRLNSGFIKFITGRDTISGRLLYGNETVQFTPRFITFFVCNDIPDTDEFDMAFSKRVKCIDFSTEFCENPVSENQRKIDGTIHEKFDGWCGDFMLLLIEHYKEYMKEKKITITKNVSKWTDQYKENSDFYLRFLNECTEECDSNISTINLYKGFCNWFTINYPCHRLPSQIVFSKNIKKYKLVKGMHIDKNTNTSGVPNLRLIDEWS
jgi:P4 family phage/plasmid primase-like protien